MAFKSVVAALGFWGILASSSFAMDLNVTLTEIDVMDQAGQHTKAAQVLESLLSDVEGDVERANLLWRLARAEVGIGNDLENAGAQKDQLLTIYGRAERYAADAVMADPDCIDGYYWGAISMASAGSVRGVMNSLFMAADMRDHLVQALAVDEHHAETYHVLAHLYAALPRVVSFGNKDYAVSLARQSVALMEAQVASGDRAAPNYELYVSLADFLQQRDWTERKRSLSLPAKREGLAEATSPLERGWYFEGVADIPPFSDRAEAQHLLAKVVHDISERPVPTAIDLDALDAALELSTAMDFDVRTVSHSASALD